MNYSIKQTLALGVLGLGVFVFTTVSLPSFKRELFPPAMGIGSPQKHVIKRTPRSIDAPKRIQLMSAEKEKEFNWERALSLCSNIFGTAAPPISLGYSTIIWLKRRREKKAIDSNPTV